MANVVDFQAVDNLKSDGFVLVYNIITIFTFQIYWNYVLTLAWKEKGCRSDLMICTWHKNLLIDWSKLERTF